MRIQSEISIFSAMIFIVWGHEERFHFKHVIGFAANAAHQIGIPSTLLFSHLYVHAECKEGYANKTVRKEASMTRLLIGDKGDRLSCAWIEYGD